MTVRGTLILVQGLAGSGKSHLIALLKSDFCLEEGFALNEQAHITQLVSALDEGKVCVVSERKYRSHDERTRFLATIAERTRHVPLVRQICFENDLDAANHNCRHRSNKSHDPGGAAHIAQNNSDTVDYDIPIDAIVVRIHRIEARLRQPPNLPPVSISTPR